jgi:hypothetical protein
MKLSALKPNDRNPRTIKTEAFARLCASIKRDPEFMVLRPIVHQGGKILGGNMRFWACQELGMKTIPDTWAVEASTLTPEQAQRFVLVDNAPDGMVGEWDWEVLATDWEVPELEAMGFATKDIDAGREWACDGNPAEAKAGIAGVRSTISFPPTVWLRQRDEVIRELEGVLSQFGGTAEWAA